MRTRSGKLLGGDLCKRETDTTSMTKYFYWATAALCWNYSVFNNQHGILHWTPAICSSLLKWASPHVIFFLTRYVLVHFGPSDNIHLNQDWYPFHLPNCSVLSSRTWNLWNSHLAYWLQASGLTKSYNSLSKLLNNRWSPKWTELLPQALILL